MHKIKLVHKYSTRFGSHDFSNGTFFEGEIIVDDVEAICEKFYSTGEIELYEATDKYLSNKISNIKTKL